MQTWLRRWTGPVLAGLFLLLGGGSSPAAAWIDGPEVAAISPDGARLYVANNVFNTIAVVDTATNQIAATVLLDPRVPVIMEGMAISPDGSRLYVSARDSGRTYSDPIPPPDPFGPLPDTVTVIDTASLQVVARVQVGRWPMGLAISRDGKRVYAANFNSGTVSVIDTGTNHVGATAHVGGWPVHVAVSPDGVRLYVAALNGKVLDVLDMATLHLVARVETEVYPAAVESSPDGKWIYVPGVAGARNDVNEVEVINATTVRLAAWVPVQGPPMGVALSPDGSRAYVTLNNSPGTVAVIDTAAGQVVGEVQAGAFSQNLVMRPDGKRLYTIDEGAGTVTVIEIGTNDQWVVAKVPVYRQPVLTGP
jgi:YVTN family beta-propeller protein